MGGRCLLLALAVLLVLGLGLLFLVGPNVALTVALVVFIAALIWRMNRRVGGR